MALCFFAAITFLLCKKQALKITQMREKRHGDYYFLFMSQNKIVKYYSGSSNPIQQNILHGQGAYHTMYGYAHRAALRMRKNCRNSSRI